MRIELKKDRVSMSENEYRQVMNELNQYKQAYQHCVDDLIVLRANNKRLERENAEQLALLKQFRKLIDYKLTLHQGSSMYREYRSKLDQLGVK
ncbi:hypothetical protein NGB25_00145 [Staphylococcus saprophyticus]|uniref:hypothetical protein n=1 Tax=Staphylococcus saprophyticus TaxID=29385 RepID=UPI002DB7CA7E|nr:hypothetical protein [Staphylococcus saprophyticus]MEB7675567.1 hypothetical protein [Staphylococcus saprophyticus]